MNVAVFGKQISLAEEMARAHGFVVVTENPDYVISHGGDGTILGSEKFFPGVPKILLKESQICKRCTQGEQVYSNEEVLRLVRAGRFVIEEERKIEARFGRDRLVALNDIVIHNIDPRHGIRYRIAFDGEPYQQEIIGDGIVVATPFGSTGYYRSITDSFFETGIGLAFNNSTEQSDHVVLREDRKIECTITRGPAHVYADNQEKYVVLQDEESVLIFQSQDVARFVRIRV
jgi:NAD+ kinase